jgi:hypothetical protein
MGRFNSEEIIRPLSDIPLTEGRGRDATMIRERSVLAKDNNWMKSVFDVVYLFIENHRNHRIPPALFWRCLRCTYCVGYFKGLNSSSPAKL